MEMEEGTDIESYPTTVANTQPTTTIIFVAQQSNTTSAADQPTSA